VDRATARKCGLSTNGCTASLARTLPIELYSDIHGFSPRDRMPLIESILKRSIRKVGHDHVQGTIRSGADPVHGQYVRRPLESTDGTTFTFEKRPASPIEPGDIEQLYGNKSIESRLKGPIDGCEPAPSDLDRFCEPFDTKVVCYIVTPKTSDSRLTPVGCAEDHQGPLAYHRSDSDDR
jgi:hypothetical protein